MMTQPEQIDSIVLKPFHFDTLRNALISYEAPKTFGVENEDIRVELAHEVIRRVNRQIDKDGLCATVIAMSDREHRVVIEALEQSDNEDAEELISHINYYKTGGGEEWLSAQ